MIIGVVFGQLSHIKAHALQTRKLFDFLKLKVELIIIGRWVEDHFVQFFILEG